MSFFESVPQPPSPEPPRRPRRRPWMRPDTVIPGSVPAEVVLVRAEAVAVAVGSIRAYPNGFEFTLHVRLRREDEEYSPGMGDPFGRHLSRRGTQEAGRALRLGVLYADGRRAAVGGRPVLPDGPGAGELVLHPNASNGSDRRWDGNFWVHPLPPDGPVTFVASWPAYGVDETRAEVDGAAIRAAASRAMLLWPDEPDYEPGSGWTSSTITAGTGDPQAGPSA